MITSGMLNIFILDGISIDYKLPKYKKEKKTENFYTVGDLSINNTVEGVGDNLNGVDILSSMTNLYNISPSFYLKFKIWLYKNLYSSNIPKDKPLNINKLQSFFDSIKYSVKELNQEEIKDILNKYETILKNAVDNNQTALIEKIKEYSTTLKYEMILCTSKFNKYLTEDDIVKFHNIASVHEKYRTGLCLTYIKNFIKIVPEEISNLKKEADELKVFDNYVILHYDYSGKSVEDTKAEKEKKKDPILFGVIKDSKNLYYIGDWIDEYCDLTLDVIIKKLGKDVNVLDSEKVKENIDVKLK